MSKTKPVRSPEQEFSEEPVIDVGLDDGYAAIKLAWYGPDGTLRTHSVPSRARSGSLGVGSLFGDSALSVGGYETEGERFTVSPGLEGEVTRFPDYNLSPLARVLAHHALIAAGFAGKQVRIASGLPLDRYFRDGKEGKRKDEHRIARKIESFARPVRRLDGTGTARIVSHSVFAQGLAAVVDWLVEGTTIRSQKDPVGVVDIGGQTTDISVINPDFQANHGHLKTCDLGVLDVRDLLGRRIQSSHDVDKISDSALDAALTTGATRIWGKDVSVQDELRDAIREIESRLANEILSVFGKEASTLETILFVGGGSLVFRNLPTRFPNAAVVDCPEFANARGLLKALSLSGRS
ncbi:MAG: conserved protein of unknown function [Leptospirillum rubarum]|jgi:plasmid segregation protein ParM|nr:MAG: conserved protein of unknown function [Leptospirillum rubarum]